MNRRVVRGQCRRTNPSLVLADSTEWGLLNRPGVYGRFGTGYTTAYPYTELRVCRVDRSTQWGNPFRVEHRTETVEGELHDRRWVVSRDMQVVNWNWSDRTKDDLLRWAVDAYRVWVDSEIKHHPEYLGRLIETQADVLSCWCKIGAPCHADVLVDRLNDRLR